MKERKRRITLPDVDENLVKILELINGNFTIVFEARSKSSKGLHNGHSNRRSRYIGVLRNRQRWQVLINEGDKKKYIGTY